MLVAVNRQTVWFMHSINDLLKVFMRQARLEQVATPTLGAPRCGDGAPPAAARALYEFSLAEHPVTEDEDTP